MQGPPPASQALVTAGGPPYLPQSAGLGGIPTVSVDVPICSVFVAIFLVAAVSHMRLFRLNLSRGHKFIPSAVTFGFCVARTVANVLRIAWATHTTNFRLAIAAQVLVAAGVILLFILNLLYAQRMLRASWPRLGWSRGGSYLFKALCILIGITLIMVIVATVQSFYTLNANTRRIDRNLQLYGGSYTTFISFLPLPILVFLFLTSRPGQPQPGESFGAGSWGAKGVIVGAASVLLTLGAGFRLGIAAMPPRPLSHPAWYHHKVCFYIFNFSLEAIVVYLYLLGRVDQRFFVPDGSSKVRSYSVEDGRSKEEGSSSSSKAVQGEKGEGQVVEAAVESK
ncbi:hypothetical protein LOZ39_002996 [Ophidiomyces ophidiicola]|nr:hypothetical protein LOZ61_001807 [Ophidiomyces ophidiicola]KAI1929964.1 hypothetical protein LOZ60_001221 [Ophidiomyces ophidiicola]KAI2010745.1 hypothetical protein LOZ49_003376 [Ophidiomyces ophidiicola]KAI2076099.1 hypothetical protein LOZ39_002996 [Ophidiomyces ophidiicola]KAI2145857.1 hypothetical protein LOZ29_000283 [Ophidiomyces ophidiicola]